jgi:hypothetical protein
MFIDSEPQGSPAPLGAAHELNASSKLRSAGAREA